jgi:hypothetical protein
MSTVFGEVARLYDRQRPHTTTTTPADFLRTVQTFGPFRRRPPEARRALLEALDELLAGYGAEIHNRVETTVVLARKP